MDLVRAEVVVRYWRGEMVVAYGGVWIAMVVHGTLLRTLV